jgi:hypothetical protein
MLDDEEIEKNIHFRLGAILGIRLDLPIKKSYLGAEMRIGRSISNIVGQKPNIIETFWTIRLIYLLRKKNNKIESSNK